jgi:MurNAc alpha-1-phosphate uridylyltransferase
MNKGLLDSRSVSDFSISEVWNQLVSKNQLYGYESIESFYHLTNLEIYKELLKNN